MGATKKAKPQFALPGLERAAIAKARLAGSGLMAVELTDADCNYLVALIAADIGCAERFPELPVAVPAFFMVTEDEIAPFGGADFWSEEEVGFLQ